MPNTRAVILFVIAALAAPAALSATAPIVVTDAWVRGTVAGQTSSGAYMEIKSSTDAMLIGVATPAAGIAEIHAMTMEGGVMKMRQVDRVPLPAGKLVALKAGESHVMLMDVRQPLKAGDTVPITLTIESKGGKKSTLAVTAKVRNLTADGTPAPKR